MVGRARVLALDRIADGVDPRTVERLEEARLLAERLGEVARRARPRVQVVDHRREIDGIDRARVGLDVRAREHLRVARGVDRGDPRAGALERLRDARRAGEEIERGARLGGLAQSGEHRDQAALRPEVLDHPGRLVGVEGGPHLGDERVRGVGSAPLEQPGDQRARRRSRRRRTARPRPPARRWRCRRPSSTGMSVTALSRRPISPAWLASVARSPVTPISDDAVDEAAGALADRDEALVGGGGCREEDGLDLVRRRRRRPSRRARRAGGRGGSPRRCRRRRARRRSARYPMWPTGLV